MINPSTYCRSGDSEKAVEAYTTHSKQSVCILTNSHTTPASCNSAVKLVTYNAEWIRSTREEEQNLCICAAQALYPH